MLLKLWLTDFDLPMIRLRLSEMINDDWQHKDEWQDWIGGKKNTYSAKNR